MLDSVCILYLAERLQVSIVRMGSFLFAEMRISGSGPSMYMYVYMPSTMKTGLETENTAVGIRYADHVAPSIRKSWH
jgi:hypothetical protein